MPEQHESLQPTLKKKCPDCPPLVVPRRGYTPRHSRNDRASEKCCAGGVVRRGCDRRPRRADMRRWLAGPER